MKFNIEQAVNHAQGIIQDALKSNDPVTLDQVKFIDSIPDEEAKLEIAHTFLQKTEILSPETCYYLQEIVNPMEMFPHPVYDPVMQRND